MEEYNARNRRRELAEQRAGKLRYSPALRAAKTWIRVAPTYLNPPEIARLKKIDLPSLTVQELQTLARDYFLFIYERFAESARIEDENLSWFQMRGARGVLDSQGLLVHEYDSMFKAFEQKDMNLANSLRAKIGS